MNELDDFMIGGEPDQPEGLTLDSVEQVQPESFVHVSQSEGVGDGSASGDGSGESDGSGVANGTDPEAPEASQSDGTDPENPDASLLEGSSARESVQWTDSSENGSADPWNGGAARSAVTDEVLPSPAQSNAGDEHLLAPISPQADGAYLLYSGEYAYTAEAEGYISAESVPFTVTDEPLTITVALETVEAEPVPFDQSKTVGGVIVRVQAEPGVFPAGAVLSVEQVPVYTSAYEAADAAVEEARDEDQNVAVSYTFDIKVIDPDTGEELQPAEGQTVSVSFALAEVADENLTTNVYHVAEDEATGGLTAEALDVTTEVTPQTGEETTATVETDGFSIYQVEFTYNKLEYVLPGDTSVAMSEILSALKLTGEVTAVSVSDDSLFSASDATGEWIVTAHQAFTTTEWMKVTINGVEYEITVTDDASYSAEFEFNGKKYYTGSITGTNVIQLTTILQTLEFTETVSDVTSFNPDAMTVAQSGDSWSVTLNSAFGSGYLKLTIGDGKYYINVTCLPNSIGTQDDVYITFDANGGSGSMDRLRVRRNTAYALPDCAFTAPEGQTFDKWEIGGLQYAVGYEYPFTEDTTAKAIWRDLTGYPVHLTYESTQGYAKVDPTKAEANTSVTVTVEPQAGYEIASVTYKAGEAPSHSITGTNGVYTFTMSDAETTVTVTFIAVSKPDVSYLNANGDIQTCNDYRYLLSNTETLTAGWYVVDRDARFENRLRTSGDVHLILKNNITLTLDMGISVNENCSLSIYS